MFRSLRISHVEFDFPGSEKLGPSRNGRMERNFPVIPIFRNLKANLARYTQNFGMKFRKMTVPFTLHPGISGIFGRMESAPGFSSAASKINNITKAKRAL